MVPESPSLTIPRCLAYQARRVSGFSDLKKIPPIPRTRAIRRMLRDRYHLNQQVRKRTAEGRFKAVARERTAYFGLNCDALSIFARFSGENAAPASWLVRGIFCGWWI